MERSLKKNVVLYHAPRTGKTLTRDQFQKLKNQLMTEFRFWLRSYRNQVYWSRRHKAVAVLYLKGTVDYELVSSRVSYFIFGFFTALDI